MPKHLVWEDNQYSVNVPVEEDEKPLFRKELEQEIATCGFVHEKNIRAFSRGGFWCEIMAFTLYANPNGEPIVCTDYFMCFIYDCRETAYSSKAGKLVFCKASKKFIDANGIAETSIDLLLRS